MAQKRPDIPDPIKREVRQRCGFGCIFCGDPIVVYDHLLGWAETRRHVPDELTLLCDKHHRRKTSKQISDEMVIQQNQEPFNRQHNQSGPLDLIFGESAEARVVLAGNTFKDEHFVAPVIIDGLPLIVFERTSCGDWLLEIRLFDRYNRPVLVVEKNELIFSTHAWDITYEGTLLTIREGHRNVMLRLRFEPPTSVIIERADLLYNGARVEVSGDTLTARGKGAFTTKGGTFDMQLGVMIGYPGVFNPNAAVFYTNVDRYTPIVEATFTDPADTPLRIAEMTEP